MDDPRNTFPDASIDSEFDLNARAELSLAYQPSEAPSSLYKRERYWRTPLVSGLLALGLFAMVGGGFFALRPPELVRGAIEHEYYERTLRGQFITSAELMPKFGLPANKPVPGFAQLMRPCDIEGNLAYHLTTFFEKGGMVTLFAFEEGVHIPQGSGWWRDVYWQVRHNADGKAVVMVAQKEKAISAANRALIEAKSS